jgi:hypothetical protein
MDLGSIFLILALSLLVGLFVSRPLFERKQAVSDGEEDPLDQRRSTLLAERDRILNALQELDFDHVLGKIPEEDYPAQRALLMQKGADVLRQLDALKDQGAAEIRPGDDLDARLEAAIAARRADARRSAPSTETPASAHGLERATTADPDDELEILLADRRRARREKSAGFCPQCGGPLQKSDRFCPKCGASLV